MSAPGLSIIDSSRLPTYRSTHVGRFHPYPMAMRRRDREEALMTTVDYRSGLEPIMEEPEPVRLYPMAHCEEGPDADVSTLELDGPVVGGEVFANIVEERKIPSKLGVVLADLAVKLRRRYLAFVAAKAHVLGKRQ